MIDKQIISWIDANGSEFILTDKQWYTVLQGTSGFYMPPISITEETVPFQYGTMLRSVNVMAREMDLPLLIKGKDELDFLLAMRILLKVFNPLKGNGKFRVTSIDGSQREIICRYLSGFEMEESSGSRGKVWQKAIGVFKAFDPFWYDTNTIVQTFSTGQTATFFPIFPLRLSSSSVFADITIDNTGDVETYPEWIIRGKGEGIIIRNLTTGEIINIDTSLGVGESITIDTRPFYKTIRKNDGTNLYFALSDDSSLWSLQEGNNNIRIEMSNATSESSVQLSYRNRYWGA